jgi:undecaprenyl-diphosphatase
LTGAVLGDCTSFFLGKFAKQRIRNIWPFRNHPKWLYNGEKFFARHGGKSIIIGRFVGPIRPVLPLVAGMLNMPSWRFISINLVSALGWAPLYILPGYFFGASLQGDITLPNGVGKLGALLLTLIIVVLIIMRLTHWHLQPNGYLYRAAHAWIDRQHSVRIFWHWLAEHRGHKPTLPLLSMLLLLGSLLTLVMVVLFNSNTAGLAQLNQLIAQHFSNIQHAWLDSLFGYFIRFSDIGFLRGLAAIFVLWLAVKRHFAAIVHIVAALLMSELLIYLWQAMLLTGITLVSGLMAAFIAQEVPPQQRWKIYSVTPLPIALVSLSHLYFGDLLITDVSCGILAGMALCGAVRISFSHYNRQAIVSDPWLWLSTIAALMWAVFYSGL